MNRLTQEQKQLLTEYIKDRRFPYMARLCCLFGLTVLMFLTFLPDLLRLYYNPESWEESWSAPAWAKESGYYALPILFFCLWIASVCWFLKEFRQGIGKAFWKNSDYDCLLHDNYQLDFRECAGKQPDSGKYPYFVSDSDGNRYQCPVFLDWKHAQKGDTLLCITLKNGQKYALLQT